MADDEDSTPRSGHKHNTDPALHGDRLVDFRLKKLEAGVKAGNGQNTLILEKLSKIETLLAVGSERFKRQESDIADLKKVNTKAITGIITGLLGVALHAIKSLFG